MPKLTAKKTDPKFSAAEFKRLCDNSYQRYTPAADKIGHILVEQSKTKTKISQFKPPNSKANKSQWQEAKNIEIFEFGKTLQAKGKLKNGTEFVARRSVEIEYKQGRTKHNATLLFCSPKKEKRKDKPLADLTPIFDLKLTKTIKTTPIKKDKVKIEPSSVKERMREKRKPTQKEAMNGSALIRLRKYFEDNKGKYTKAQMKEIENRFLFKKGSLLEALKKDDYPEWMHVIAYSLTPKKDSPQTQKNLSVGPKVANTTMMPIERTVSMFATKRTRSKQLLEAKFTHLANSDVIANGEVKGTISEDGQSVSISAKIHPWAKKPINPRATDLAQTAYVTHALLRKTKPTVETTMVLRKREPVMNKNTVKQRKKTK
jgi:hypothetical protein